MGRESGRNPLVAKPSTECLQPSCKHSGRGEAHCDRDLALPLTEAAVDLDIRAWLQCRSTGHTVEAAFLARTLKAATVPQDRVS